MSIKESLYFTYDDIDSRDMGIINVGMEAGMLSEPFLPEQEIYEVEIAGKESPYFQKIKKRPLVLTLSFAFEETWNESLIHRVKRWLAEQEYYKPMIFSEMPEKIFYCIYTGSPELLHNGLKQGVVQNITFRCNSPYVYSPFYESEIYDFSESTEPEELIFVNEGDTEIWPQMLIEIQEDGDMSIANLSDGGKKLKFTELVNGERIFIDNEMEIITTDIIGTYRYDNHNGVFLRMLRGINNLHITGKVKLQFKYRYKFY